MGATCIAAAPLITVYQQPDYPVPGQGFSYPPGMLFSVCADGRAFRALSYYDVGGSGLSGTISQLNLEKLKAELETKWLAPVRAECKARGVALDTPSLRIEAPASSTLGEIECSLS